MSAAQKVATGPSARRLKVGTDIGGTFTDFVAIDDATGEIWLEKTLTTPADPSQGIFNGLASYADNPGLNVDDYQTLVHGTTLVINALIERKGASTALITTAGFRDVLEMRDELRYDVYDLQIEFPAPLAPRKHRFEIAERTAADGRVLQPVQEEQVRELAQAIRKAEVKTVAICLLNSHSNSDNEKALATLLRALAPELSVTASHEVLPQIGEYKRSSTAVANAYVKPLIAAYLDRLDAGLRDRGFKGDLFIMQSGGGVFGKDAAKTLPIRILESGPAGGVAAAKWWGELTGTTDILAFDMGGTTAKLCTIVHGEALVTEDYEAARLHHFKPGSGLAISVPVLDLLEIGTGGGSIAHIDSLGLLKVGPYSAGASPGPACYGLGGTLPTVTDANVALGYLDPHRFLGGKMRLDVSKAVQAITAPTGVAHDEGDAFDAAYRIHDLANEDMAAAAKLYLAERGKDPQQLTMVAYGGAGPGHAHALAQKLGIEKVLIPPAAGVMSALGMLVEKLSTEQVRTYSQPLEHLSAGAIRAAVAAMKTEAAQILNVGVERLATRIGLDLRYRGQGFNVKLVLDKLDGSDSALRTDLAARFREAYAETYGRVYDDVAIETTNLRLVASTGGDSAFTPRRNAAEGRADGKPRAYRKAYFGAGQGHRECAVFDRNALVPERTYVGPAFVEDRETTIVIRPGSTFAITAYGVLTIESKQADAQGGA